MKAFDRTNLKNIRADLNAVLAKYGKSDDITFNIGSIRFSAGEFTTKITAKLAGVKTVGDGQLEHMMKFHNLQAIGMNGRILTGYNSRAFSYPFQYVQVGKKYKCSLAKAIEYFAKAK